MYQENTVREFLESVKTKDMPGGGSVAAYTAALGAALNLMVANLSYGKKAYESKSEEIKNQFDKDYKEIEEKIELLVKKMEEDASAFDGVLHAFTMPRDTEEEKKARKEVMQKGYLEATITPLETAEIILETLKLQRSAAEHGDVWAITDQGVGTLLLAASGEAALLNVIINLKSIDDGPEKDDIVDRHETVIAGIHALKQELMGSCYRRLEEMK